MRKENQYDLSGEYAIGYTPKGEEFWVDKEDVEMLKQLCWFYGTDGYVIARNPKENPLNINREKIYLHVLVMGGYAKEFENKHLIVDHIKHPPEPEHKIDNRKSNLRFATISQNQQNKTIQRNNTSGITGVVWRKDRHSWRAEIKVNGKTIYLGSSQNKDEAIKLRRDAEIKYFGEYCYNINNKGEN